MQEENGKLFCPGLTKTILNQIFRNGGNASLVGLNGLGSGHSGSLNINKADTELQKKRSKIVARNLEKSLMILFLKGCSLQLTLWIILNFLKTFSIFKMYEVGM